MPELPEVETIRRALQARLVGRRFVEVVQRRPDLRFPLPARLPSRLRGRRIEAVRRRAKYLLAELDDGHVLIVHLGMSGRLVLGGAPAGLHEHLTFGFDDGAVLRFVDARRFGSVDLTAAARLGAHPRLVDLGLEPLDPAFTGPALRAALGTTQTPLKVALMDQGRVVGVGNIYACEALFRARLSPRRAGGSLGTREATRLARAIQAVLAVAIHAGGSSLRDYVQADGELGFFQDSFAVYGRAALACPRCGGAIERLVQANRSTFFCPRCQA